MIIKGSARGNSAADTKRLADHLLAHDNERVAVLETRGVGADRLHEAFEEMRAVSLATRTRRPLYHASISPTADEARLMAPRHWIEAADELERLLGLAGHPRLLVRHDKRGRGHLHIVWARAHPVTLKVAHDGHTYAKHEACARALERRWRLRPVVGAHNRPEGIARPVAAATHQCWQAEVRTGVRVADIATTLRRCWSQSTDGRDFAAAAHQAGLRLARGRRGIVAVDPAGTPHSLPRRLGIKANQVRLRLADIDPATLPSVEAAKAAARQPSPPGRKPIMPKNTFTVSASRPPRRKTAASQPTTPLDAAYWRSLGFEVEAVGPVLLVTLAPGVRLEDCGDRLTLRKDGPPTAEETRLMVAAAKARGWQGIRFSGGTPEWQRAARIEAIRQGFDPADVSIECEDHGPPPALAMPDHLRRRIAPPPPDKDRAPKPVPGGETAPAYRP